MGVPVTTSVTGISRTECRSCERGFTLIEVMVVLTIIGLLVGGAVLSLGLAGAGSEARRLEAQLERLRSELEFMRERAIIEARPYGLRITPEGYRPFVFDTRLANWQPVDDRTLRPVRWSGRGEAAPVIELSLDGRRVVLDADQLDPGPQLGVDSEGEFSIFSLQLAQIDGGQWQLQPTSRGTLAIVRLDELIRQ